MRFELHPHPGAAPALTLAVELDRTQEGLALTYRVEGDLSAIIVPPLAPAVRADELWRSTCLELFVRDKAGEGYREFNFSPSGQWAAYGFDGYRSGMRAIGQDDPSIRARAGPAELTVEVELPGDFPEGAPVGLSAVIEASDGTRSFWALAHGGSTPDFHHEACFAATVPPIAPQ